MPVIKCDNCNHSMIPRKDFYECPICHNKKVKAAVLTKEVKNNHKSDLVDYVNKGIDNKTLLSVLIKNVLTDNPKDEMALLLASYLEKDTNPDSYKNGIKSFFLCEEEKIYYEPTFKYLVNNSDYKFLTYLDSILSNTEISEECRTSLELKKKEIEELIERTSVINSDVFVCYSSNDLSKVNAIVNTVEEAGYTCWYADRNMPKNNPVDFEYKKKIEQAIRNCKVFLVVASKNSMYSSDVQWEIDIASSLCYKRIEYLISTIKHTPKFKDFFDGKQWIDATESDQTEVLVERINFLINNKEVVKETSEEIYVEEDFDDGYSTIYQDDSVEEYREETQNTVDTEDFKDNEITHVEEIQTIDSKNLGIKAFECKNYDEAISRFKDCKVDSEIEYYLGKIYLDQYGNKYNLDEGYIHFMKSDDYRLYEEANNLGKKYYTGNGCAVDLNKAFKCFVKSSDLGNDKAMCNVAICYIRGDGVEKNISLASDYYKKAADKGNVKAMYEYGNICLDDNIRNFQDGIEYLIKAANAGLADAQYRLGICYYKGYGVSIDYNRSLDWLDKAISGGSKAAQDYKISHFNNDINYDNSCALELDNLDDLDI